MRFDKYEIIHHFKFKLNEKSVWTASWANMNGILFFLLFGLLWYETNEEWQKNFPNTKENSISIQYARKIRFVLYINEKMNTNLTFRGVDKKNWNYSNVFWSMKQISRHCTYFEEKILKTKSNFICRRDLFHWLHIQKQWCYNVSLDRVLTFHPSFLWSFST